MKKLVIFLVLIMSLGFYVACDSGGGDSGGGCDEPISATSTSLSIDFSDIDINGSTYHYYSFTPDTTGTYNIVLTADNSFMYLELNKSDPTCLDDAIFVKSIQDDTAPYSTTDTVDLTADVSYVLFIHNKWDTQQVYSLSISN